MPQALKSILVLSGGNPCPGHQIVGMSKVLPYPNLVVYEMVPYQIVCVSIITNVFCDGEP